MDITELLVFSVAQNASDLHISAGEAPIVRVDGTLQRAHWPILDAEKAHALVLAVMDDATRQDFEQRMDVDFSYTLHGVARFRVNVFQQSRGVAAVFRIIPAQIMSLDDVGAPPILRDVLQQRQGLVLTTGPTGSGKSTTLAAMVDYINETRNGHILTIEDPVEFVHASKNCLINQREVHQHTQSFNAALRSALREDPDVILIGELRDLETIRLALTAAETGHLVLGTLHTNTAASTVDRIIDVFPAGEKAMVRSMLASSLAAVVSQALVPSEKGGRVAAHEIMLGVPAVRNLIRENKVGQLYSVMQTGQRLGMRTLDQSLQALVARGTVSAQAAHVFAHDKRLFGNPANGMHA